MTGMLLLIAPSSAQAQQPGSTLVAVGVVGDRPDARPTLQLEIWLPVDELDFAYDMGLSEDPVEGVVEQRSRLTELHQEGVAITLDHLPFWPLWRLASRDTAPACGRRRSDCSR